MPASTPCPDVQVLQRLLLGRVSPPELEHLDEHVLHCERCAAALNGLWVDDPLLQSLRGAQAAAALDPAAQALIERLSHLPAVAAGASASPTLGVEALTTPPEQVAPCDGTPAAPGPTEYPFLRPSQGPGELGRLGGYRVVKQLGRGGMGDVFLAEDLQLERTVALKVMRPEVAVHPEARQRFLREARAAARVKDDHVVAIYNVGEDNSAPFLIMEYLQGTPLDAWLNGGERPTVRQILHMARDIARGLAAAHARGLVHRDVKPANLWLEAETGRVKVLDFGLARGGTEEVHLTQLGAILGTPGYMAPEQARGEPADARSDLFSLGCVLYRLCTGEAPFQGPTVMAVLTALATQDPAPVRQRNAGIPEPLADLVTRLLARRPEDRPASAQAVLQELQAIERQQAPESQLAVAALPAEPAPRPVAIPSAEGKVTAWQRRPPWWLLIAAALLVPVGAAALGALVIRITGNDGKQTEIRVPDGSKVAVNEKGEIDVRLPGAGDQPGAATAPGASMPFPPLDPAWVSKVQAMKPEDQVQAVALELRQRNPGFGGKLSPPVVENGAVIGLGFFTDRVTDISPVAALPGLRRLGCDGSDPRQGRLADLSPLRGLPLTSLEFCFNPVADLSPLAGMRLTRLDCSNTQVEHLEALRGMPLTALDCGGTKVSDSSPLRGMRLEHFTCDWTALRDLSLLQGMPIRYLRCTNTPVANLSPLQGMPLEHLECWGTQVSDLSPLRGAPLLDLRVSRTGVVDLAPLRGMKLTFFECFDTRVHDLAPLQGMPLEHLDCFLTAVRDLSPLHGAPLTNLYVSRTQVEDLAPLRGMKLDNFACFGTRVRDLSPLRGMSLRKINVWQTQVTDLSILKGMPLDQITCDFQPERDGEVLRSIKTLEVINGKPAAEFWKEVGAAQPGRK
jgi:predicted Ser/Thr protein kinase